MLARSASKARLPAQFIDHAPNEAAQKNEQQRYVQRLLYLFTRRTTTRWTLHGHSVETFNGWEVRHLSSGLSQTRNIFRQHRQMRLDDLARRRVRVVRT